MAVVLPESTVLGVLSAGSELSHSSGPCDAHGPLPGTVGGLTKTATPIDAIVSANSRIEAGCPTQTS